MVHKFSAIPTNEHSSGEEEEREGESMSTTAAGRNWVALRALQVLCTCLVLAATLYKLNFHMSSISKPSNNNNNNLTTLPPKQPIAGQKHNPPHQGHNPNGKGQQQPNVLLIMTDQQRFDAFRRVQDGLPYYNNCTKIRTPNLDRLSKMGVFFQNAYTQSPMCVPARASLRSGCTTARTGLQKNGLLPHPFGSLQKMKDDPKTLAIAQKIESVEGIDDVMSSHGGYNIEYYGKWHMTDNLWKGVGLNWYDYESNNFTFSYRGTVSHKNQYMDFLSYQKDVQHNIGGRRKYMNANFTQISSNSDYPYKPSTIDKPNVVQVGEDSLSYEYSRTKMVADFAIEALDRFMVEDKEDPFFLTVSFTDPHPSVIAQRKYLEYYQQNLDQIHVPPSIENDRSDTSYYDRSYDPNFRDSEKVKDWTAHYYATVEEVDDNIGHILDNLGSKEAENTLVIFTSDHGEMLGAHGMNGKGVAFEHSAHIPLLMSFPGKIPNGLVIDEPVSHLDVFATILDYAGLSHFDQSDGSSLRPLIEKQRFNEDFDESFIVVEMHHSRGFLVRKGNYKLIIHALAMDKDMLYDLENDPHEINNLLVQDSASLQTLGKAEHLRCLLLDWMQSLDGTEKYYSEPLGFMEVLHSQGYMKAVHSALFGALSVTKEIYSKQDWAAPDFWISDSTLSFGPFAHHGEYFVRNEFLYLGMRSGHFSLPKTIQLSLVGEHSKFFQLLPNATLKIAAGACAPIKISCTSDNLEELVTQSSKNLLDASLKIEVLHWFHTEIRMVKLAVLNK